MKKVLTCVVLALVFSLLGGLTVFASDNITATGAGAPGETITLTFTISGNGEAGFSFPLGDLVVVGDPSDRSRAVGANTVMVIGSNVLINIADVAPINPPVTFTLQVTIPTDSTDFGLAVIEEDEESTDEFDEWYNAPGAAGVANRAYYAWRQVAANNAFYVWYNESADNRAYFAFRMAAADNGNGNGADAPTDD